MREELFEQIFFLNMTKIEEKRMSCKEMNGRSVGKSNQSFEHEGQRSDVNDGKRFKQMGEEKVAKMGLIF